MMIKDEILPRYSLHVNQHAYQAGKSINSALHNLVAKVERSFGVGEVALGCFMDIQGAFNNTNFEVIR